MNKTPDPIHYIEAILKDGSEAIESYKESDDLTKLIGFTHRCIPQLERLEDWVEQENFIQCLKKYDKWVAVGDIGEHKHVVVKIDTIDWERKVIDWHNITEEYPKGGSVFDSFKKEFFPWRDLK